VACRSGGEALLLVAGPEAASIDAVPALGYRAAAPGSIGFDAARLPATACVARGADAEAAWARAGLAASIGGAALAVGSALAAVELGRRHTEERIAFGKPLARQQAVGNKLVESRRAAEAGRQLAWQAARLADLGEDAGEIAAMARLTAVDAALLAADESIQMHGGYGFTVEYHVERHYRDAKMLEVLDGGAAALREMLLQRVAARA
jgi:alkylation response protein AidB-like acyl-CoA dehydrogenase